MFYCPVCKSPVKWEDNKYRPFCGERCKMIDLGVWAGEGYRIPVENEDGQLPSGTGGEDDGGG